MPADFVLAILSALIDKFINKMVPVGRYGRCSFFCSATSPSTGSGRAAGDAA
jgi:hypothetical protein